MVDALLEQAELKEKLAAAHAAKAKRYEDEAAAFRAKARDITFAPEPAPKG
jgi:hypothetical protein